MKRQLIKCIESPVESVFVFVFLCCFFSSSVFEVAKVAGLSSGFLLLCLRKQNHLFLYYLGIITLSMSIIQHCNSSSLTVALPDFFFQLLLPSSASTSVLPATCISSLATSLWPLSFPLAWQLHLACSSPSTHALHIQTNSVWHVSLCP